MTTDFRVAPVRLQGRHLSLVPLEQSHAGELAEVGGPSADWDYLPFNGLADARAALNWIDQAASAGHVAFAYLESGSGRVIGTSRYMNIRARDRGLEIGSTYLAAPWQRSAINTEAKYLLLRHAFETLGALRVEFKTDARNLRSQRAIERIGAIREGVFRRHMIAQHGFVRDSVYYAITDLDWPGVRDRLEHLLAR